MPGISRVTARYIASNYPVYRELPTARYISRVSARLIGTGNYRLGRVEVCMNTSGWGENFHFHAFYFVSGSCREGLIARGMWISDGAVDAQALRKFDGQSVEYVQCAATIDPSKEDSSNEWSATSSRWWSRILIYGKNCLKSILWATQILTMTTCLLTNDQRLFYF